MRLELERGREDGCAIAGGEEDHITVAVNWCLNPNLRWGVSDLSALVTPLEVDW